jgi:hypothetical protein
MMIMMTIYDDDNIVHIDHEYLDKQLRMHFHRGQLP